MNPYGNRVLGMTLAAVVMPQVVGASESEPWAEGHGDLAFDYIDGDWRATLRDGSPVDAYTVILGTHAEHEVPPGDDFSFLGSPGDPVWINPQVSAPGIPFLGFNAEETNSGVFMNDRFDLVVSEFSGPGEFFIWTTDGGGRVSVSVNSANRLDTDDRLDVPANGHFHENWGFSSPGTFLIGFQASGTLVDGTPVESEVEFMKFEVSVAKEGELDLEVLYEGGEWELALLDEATETEFELNQIALHAGPNTWTRNTYNEAFAFLGEPGRPLMVLPQDEQEGVLYLGIAGDEIEAGVFEDDTVALSLHAVDGPGDVFLYEVDPLGAPVVHWNSADGLTGSDHYEVAAGSHAHANWAFTAPGIYRLTLEASGVLTSTGAEVASEDATLLVEVFAPEFLDEGEVDFEIAFEDGEWEIAAHVHGGDDHDHGDDDQGDGHEDDHHDEDGELCLADVVLQAVPGAQITVPEGDAFAFLGASGSVVSVLPQDEMEDVLYLGLAGDSLETGVFENDSAEFRLLEVRGPGSFSLYQTDAFGVPTVYFNSAEGITDLDVYPVAAGSHAHANWGFTVPGIYYVTVQAAGVLVEGGETTVSDPVTVVFDILDDDHSEPEFEEGELDLEVVYEGGDLEFAFLDEATDTEFGLDALVLEAVASTWTRNTDNPAFAFLGEPGKPLFILPQEEREGVLYLGIAGDEIDTGVFAGDVVNLSLTAVDGPGSVFLYEVDPLGLPTVFWDSSDGLSFSETYAVSAGSHAHVNWAFTEPGTYLLSLQASGTLASSGDTVSSDVATLVVDVVSPEFFYEGELDIEVAFEDAEWEIAAHVHDDDPGHDDDDGHGHDDELHIDEIVLRAVPQALALVPENTAFGFLGTPGSVVSVLPQDETEGVLFLGIASEDLETGMFENDSVDLHLLDLEGPGAFSLYEVDAFGTPTVFFNTADDITESDVYPVAVGSHAHANWGFTVPGVYRATVQASGVLVESGETSMSEPVILVFDILLPEPMEGAGLRATFVDASTLELTFDTTAGLSYRVQIRDSLSAGGWTSVGIAIPGTGAAVSVTFPIDPGSTSRFYQIVEE